MTTRTRNKKAIFPLNAVQWLKLTQLADSAVPIGSAAHSFGVETLTTDETLTVDELEAFFRDYLTEAGSLEAAYCRAAASLSQNRGPGFAQDWLALNEDLGALKPARESRAASATLGRRLLQLAANLEQHPRLAEALRVSREARADVHHSTAFGLVGGVLEVEADTIALCYLQQSLMGLVSACQRLMPLGQQRASDLLWRLKPVIVNAVGDAHVETAACFTPVLDMAAMQHPGLPTRLFIS